MQLSRSEKLLFAVDFSLCNMANMRRVRDCGVLREHCGRESDRMEESEDGVESCQMLLSGHGVVVVLMNSEQLCLPTQGQASQ